MPCQAAAAAADSDSGIGLVRAPGWCRRDGVSRPGFGRWQPYPHERFRQRPVWSAWLWGTRFQTGILTPARPQLKVHLFRQPKIPDRQGFIQGIIDRAFDRGRAWKSRTPSLSCFALGVEKMPPPSLSRSPCWNDNGSLARSDREDGAGWKNRVGPSPWVFPTSGQAPDDNRCQLCRGMAASRSVVATTRSHTRPTAASR